MYQTNQAPQIWEKNCEAWCAQCYTGWSICSTKESILSVEFSSNFDDFLQPKSPILRIFDNFSNKNGQNGKF